MPGGGKKGYGGGIVNPTVVPRSTALTTLDRAKSELIIDHNDDDTLLQQMIDEASETVYSQVGIDFYRAQWQETNFGGGWNNYVLRNRPVLSLEEAAYLGAVQSDVSISDDEAGILYRAIGFDTSEEANEWSFTYTAGWWLPGDDYSGSVSASATDDSYNSAAADFPTLLRPNDVINAEGFSNAANNGFKIVASATASKIIVTDALTTESAGSRSFGLRNLPGWIERVAIDLVKLAYQARARDPAMSNLSLGSELSMAWNDKATEAIRRELSRLSVPV